LAAEKLYHYFWHTFADIVIEKAKPRLTEKNNADKQSAQYTLYTMFVTLLKLLHPFMPFVTEQIWTYIPKKSDSRQFLITERWPHL